MLVDSVHLEFGKLTVLQSAFVTSERGKVTGVLGGTVRENRACSNVLWEA